MLSDLLNAEPNTSTPSAGPSRSRLSVQTNGRAQDPSSDDDIVALDYISNTSRSPSNRRSLDVRASATPQRQRENPMSLKAIDSPDPTSRPGTSGPSPLPSPAAPASSRGTGTTLQASRPSQQDSEDVTMDEGNDGDADEDEEIGDTTAVMEDGEDGDGVGDEEDEENDDDSDEGSSGESSDSGDDEEDLEITGPRLGPDRDSLLPGAVKVETGEQGAADGSAVVVEGEVNTLVPKKKKSRKREASTDEGLPPPPKPIPTIRLEFKLNREGEDSEFNVLEAAQGLGLIPNWASNEEVEAEAVAVDAAEPVEPGPSLLPGMDSLSAEEIARRIDEQHAAQERAKAKSKKKVVKRVKDVYDLEDEFIDDSEIAIDDAETHVPRPTKEGFFVHAGPLEIMSAPVNKSGPKRPPAKKARIAEDDPLPSLAATTALKLKMLREAGETRSDPLVIDTDDEQMANAEAGPSSSPVKPIKPEIAPLGDNEFPQALMKVDRLKYHGATNDPRWLPPFPLFPPPVQRTLLELRQASENHPWPAKKSNGKASFPQDLKKPLAKAGQAIYEHELLSEREEDLRHGIFASLPACLPFNTTTLRRLFYRTCQEAYWIFLVQCEETGLERLSYYVKQEQDKWIAKYNESVEQWKQKGSDGDAQTIDPVPSTPAEVDDEAGAGAAAASQKGNPEPKKLSIWSSEMKETFGQLVDNYEDMADLNRTLLKLEIPNNHSDREHTETNMKSRLYKRAIDVFPEGYTSSTQLSRYSSSTRKSKKQPAA